MMPLRLRRKTRTMEKVENLYRTARVQNAVPRHLHHVVEICDQNASSFRDGEVLLARIPNRRTMVRRRVRIDLGAIHRGKADGVGGPGQNGLPGVACEGSISQPVASPDMSHFSAEFSQILRRLRLRPLKF